MGKNPLGRGLASLLGESRSEGELFVRQIPVDKIVSNPYQPRQQFLEEEIKNLADSISNSGLLQPIIVRRLEGTSDFELIAGERRLRAVKLLGWKMVPAIIREVDYQEMAVLALIENVQRKDINPIEEAEAYKRLMEEFSLTQAEVARLVGKSRSRVANVLRLLNLPKEIKQQISEGKLSFSQARELLSGSPTIEELKRRANKVINNKITVSGIKKERDIFSRRMEEIFQQILGTKVVIEHNERKGRGKIIIEYYSLKDLDGMLQMFKEGRRQLNASGISVN